MKDRGRYALNLKERGQVRVEITSNNGFYIQEEA